MGDVIVCKKLSIIVCFCNLHVFGIFSKTTQKRAIKWLLFWKIFTMEVRIHDGKKSMSVYITYSHFMTEDLLPFIIE